MLKNQKGFLGPIGDDLPSLIPLVFALIIFFGAFGVTFTSFSQRTEEFRLQIDALRISTDLKGNSYYSNYSEFKELCDSVNSKGIKFRAGLIELNKQLNIESPDYYSQQIIDPENGTETVLFKCENTEEELSILRLSQQKPIYRDFPVVLNENFVVKPLSLFVAVWK